MYTLNIVRTPYNTYTLNIEPTLHSTYTLNKVHTPYSTYTIKCLWAKISQNKQWPSISYICYQRAPSKGDFNCVFTFLDHRRFPCWSQIDASKQECLFISLLIRFSSLVALKSENLNKNQIQNRKWDLKMHQNTKTKDTLILSMTMLTISKSQVWKFN